MTQNEAVGIAQSTIVEELKKTEKRTANIILLQGRTKPRQKRYERILNEIVQLECDWDHPIVTKEDSVWRVSFGYIFPPGYFRSPGLVIVIVDDVTGHATIEPQM